MLTGDSLFVGDAARPDLAVGAREGAEGLFRSLRRLMELADGVEVFPGHVAGSLCGKAMSSKPSTTIGFERRFNPTLRSPTSTRSSRSRPRSSHRSRRTSPVSSSSTAGPSSAPPHPSRSSHAPPRRRTAPRRPHAVGGHLAGHRPGAVNVPVVGTSFATKAGFVLDAYREVCVLAETADEAQRASAGLRSVAFFDIAGYVLGDGARGPTRSASTSSSALTRPAPR